MFRAKKPSKKHGEPMIICICGMAGSGKSTLAKRIAEEYDLRYFSGGDALMALAIEEGYRHVESGWWESREGMRFLEKRSKDQRFDKVVDEKLLEVAGKGDVVLDSWTMPWLLQKGLKIWLEASPRKRTERIVRRDKIPVEEAVMALEKKERQTRAIYKKMYGFDLGEDYTPFNFILDTESLNADEVFQVLCVVIDNVLLRSQVSPEGQ